MSLGSYSPASLESHQFDDNIDDSIDEFISEICKGNIDMTDNEPQIIQPSNSQTAQIKILIQPVEKFRFRYKSEMMGTHGSLLGEKEGSIHRKEAPTVQLVNCIYPKAIIRCTLVTSDEDKRYPHAHHLVKKYDTEDKDDPHDIEVSNINDYTASFHGMGIIHTAKKNIKDQLFNKRTRSLLEKKQRDNITATLTTSEITELTQEAEGAQKWMNLNSVALCFQGFALNDYNVPFPITDEVYSRPINNLKSALTGELKICRISKIKGSCEGNDEVWILVEKVGKKNIKVKFYETEGTTDDVIWSAYGSFSELDVHHQYAIVVKTPPYKDQKITESKKVFIRLERPSDEEASNSMQFHYSPSKRNQNRKRSRITTDDIPEQYMSTTDCTLLSKFNSPQESQKIDVELKNHMSGEISDPDLLDFFKDEANYKPLIDCFVRSDFVFDGVTNAHAKSNFCFAKDVLLKIFRQLRESKNTTVSKEIAKCKIKELLQEITTYGDTPLHHTLRNQQFDIFEYLILIISSDASYKDVINFQNSNGQTPLHLAICNKQKNLVYALLKLGADPNICDEDDATSLHVAVEIGAEDCVDELLKSKVPLNLEAQTDSGWCALHYAAKVGSLHCVKALIAAGADVNAVDLSYGRSVLHIAADYNLKNIVKYLVTKTNININAKNFGGHTALRCAEAKTGDCAQEIIDILKRNGAVTVSQHDNNSLENVTETYSKENVNQKLSQLTIENTMSIVKSECIDDDYEDMHPDSFNTSQNYSKQIEVLTEETIDKTMELHFKEENQDAEEYECDDHIFLQKDIPFLEEHADKIKQALDKSKAWEKLANYTNNGHLIRLYRKKESPSKALLRKIQLAQSGITVTEMQDILKEIGEYNIARILDN